MNMRVSLNGCFCIMKNRKVYFLESSTYKTSGYDFNCLAKSIQQQL